MAQCLKKFSGVARMNNLMDSIQVFKAKRQMAKRSPAEQDELSDMVYLYRTIRSGQDAIREEFARRWEKLPENKRTELVDRLLKAGLLPQIVGYALEIFEGRAISLV